MAKVRKVRSVPYTHSISRLCARQPGDRVRLGGRLVQITATDVVLSDATGEVTMTCKTPPPGLPEDLRGCWATVDGSWDGQQIVEGHLQLSTKPAVPFPPAGGEWVWFHADERRRARLVEHRATLLRTLRRFFDDRAYLEVETPLFVRSPGTEIHLDAFEVAEPAGYLITSPELQMKRLLAAGFSRIYQIGRCFRRDEAGVHHEPEFTMLEWYRTFIGMETMMEETETLVAFAAETLLGTTEIDGVDFAPPWERLTVADAFERHADTDAMALASDPGRFFLTLAESVQPALGGSRPTFLVDWPSEFASLARRRKDDPRVAERFEAYVRGIELCNGFGELVDPAEQSERFEADRTARKHLGRPDYPVDERFLAALSEGLPEASGNALGVDRLLMLFSSAECLDDVVAFGQNRR